MNFYEEGRQARRDGDYDRARELYEEGTAQNCVKCAFELVMWENHSIFSFPEARRVCTEAKYVPYLMSEMSELMSLAEMDQLTRDADFYSRALYFWKNYQGGTYLEYLHKAWKEERNPHACVTLCEKEALEFAAREGVGYAYFVLHTLFNRCMSHLRIAAIQGNKFALTEYTNFCFNNGNAREGAQLTVFWHKHDCQLDECAFRKRLPLATDPVELHEYGKYICYQGIPACLMSVQNAILARNIYVETYTRCKQTVLYWMWTRLLPRDLILLIGKRLIWDTCRDDPHLWREMEERALKSD